MVWHETGQAGLRQIPQHPDRPWSIQIDSQRIEKGLLRPSREGVDRRRREAHKPSRSFRDSVCQSLGMFHLGNSEFPRLPVVMSG